MNHYAGQEPRQISCTIALVAASPLRSNPMKKLLSALAVAGLAAIAAAPPANAAACWWNGYTWVCHAPVYRGYGYRPYWYGARNWRYPHYSHYRHPWAYDRPHGWYR